LENYVLPDKKLEFLYLGCRHKDQFRFTVRDIVLKGFPTNW